MTEADRIVIGADQLRSEIRDRSIKVIDVRRPVEYTQGHIPTSVNLPLGDLLSDDGPERACRLFGSAGIDDETPVAVYDDTFGALASRMAWTLEYMGHRKVSLLDTTYGGWTSLGLDCDTQVPEVTVRKNSAALRPEMMATADDLEQTDDAQVTLIDNRERLNYLEQHIPGAISIPYRTLASQDSIIRPGDELRRLLNNRGVSPDSGIITYCGSVGTLSGLGYYALKSAGVTNVRLYVRSFKEWKGLEKPIEKQEHANYWDLSAE